MASIAKRVDVKRDRAIKPRLPVRPLCATQKRGWQQTCRRAFLATRTPCLWRSTGIRRCHSRYVWDAAKAAVKFEKPVLAATTFTKPDHVGELTVDEFRGLIRYCEMMETREAARRPIPIPDPTAARGGVIRKSARSGFWARPPLAGDRRV